MSAEKQYNIAKHYFDIDQYEKVLATLANPSEELLNRERYWWMMGWSHYKLRNMKEARRYAERGLTIAPDFRGLHLTLYQVERREKKYDKAEKRLAKLLEDSPEDERLLIILAQLHMERDQLYDAAKVLRKAQMINPDNQHLPIMQSNLAFQQGSMNDALAYTANALQDNPDDKLAHQIRGAILLELGESQSASEHLNTAINLGATSPSVMEAARQAKSRGRWFKRILRPIYRFGHVGVMLMWFLPMLFLLAIELNIAAGVIALLAIPYHLYALVMEWLVK